MKRLLAVLGVLVFAASACGASTEAFSVNGDGVDREALTVLSDQIAVFQPPPPSSEGTASADYTRFVIASIVRFELFVAEVEERGIETTSAHRAAGVERVDADGFLPDTELYDLLVRVEAARAAVREQQFEVTDEVVQEFYDNKLGAIPTQFCTAHVLVPERQDAEEVLDALDAGTDFATLAFERSTDTGSAQAGGELGCVGLGQFVPEFEEAVLAGAASGDTIVGPVESQFGFHVIRIDSVGRPPIDEIRPQIEAFLADPVSFVESASQIGEDVDVDSRYGIWDADLDDVVLGG